MTENPTMVTESEIQTFQAGTGEIRGYDEIGTQRISVVSDQSNGFHCNQEKSDSFVVDIEGLNHSVDTNSSSRITRNLSRKGSLRGAGEKRTGSSPTSNERDGSLLSVGSSSPKASTVGSGMPEVPLGTAVGTAPSHHQITITAENIGPNNAESKWSNRRSYSFRRPPPTWAVDPRKILLFFATVSSMGTILLIYFTLSMSKAGIEDAPLE
ncbi:unnamed protein product [Rhodiola kirilowii]